MRDGPASRCGSTSRWMGRRSPAPRRPHRFLEARSGNMRKDGVPGTGVEPALPCGNQTLNLARLPIPPPGHRERGTLDRAPLPGAETTDGNPVPSNHARGADAISPRGKVARGRSGPRFDPARGALRFGRVLEGGGMASSEGSAPVLGAGQERVELPAILPVLPVRDVVVFPGVTVPLAIGRAGSLAALQRAGQGGFLVVATQRDPATDEPTLADLHRVACVARV